MIFAQIGQLKVENLPRCSIQKASSLVTVKLQKHHSFSEKGFHEWQSLSKIGRPRAAMTPCQRGPRMSIGDSYKPYDGSGPTSFHRELANLCGLARREEGIPNLSAGPLASLGNQKGSAMANMRLEAKSLQLTAKTLLSLGNFEQGRVMQLQLRGLCRCKC